jgi:hypothetical protein
VFSIGLDEELVCSITNDDIAPTLTLNKTVVNDDGGIATEDDFQAWITDVPVDWGVPVIVDAGTLGVSESGQSGYTSDGWSGDCDSDGSITMALDTDYICEITNDDIPTDPVPVFNRWSIALMILLLLGTGWYFRPARVKES